MGCITLLTDFGLRDGFVGIMKGVIWSIAPEVQIADLTHLIEPQNVRHGALVLARATGFFPAGTVHLAVVDPGVGTERRPIALRFGEQYFVGPDNGLCSLVLAGAERAGQDVQAVHLDQGSFWLPEVSSVFHGRDIFSPVAAHLARGTPLAALGSRITDLVRLAFPAPVATATGLQGEIVMIDHFGNLGTNIEREHLAGAGAVRLRLREVEVRGLVRTFGDRPPGELIALFGSDGHLFFAVVNGSAKEKLGAEVGDGVEVVMPRAPSGEGDIRASQGRGAG